MEFNKIVFPKPRFDYEIVKNYKDELIFIPKSKGRYEFIPCLFIRDRSTNNSKNIIIMFHGNAEDIFGARTMGETLCKKVKMNVIIVEYPGYSIYQSEPSTDKILENTTIIYDYIKQIFDITDKNIFIFGRSIGTSPAIYLASKRKPNALFTVSAFTSIKSVADNLVGFLKILVRERLESIDYIRNITCPILFIHGQNDHLIPFKETILLKDNCDCPFQVYLPENITHNDFDIDSDIINPIIRFIEQHCNIDKTKNEYDKNEKINELFIIPSYIDSLIKKNIKQQKYD